MHHYIFQPTVSTDIFHRFSQLMPAECILAACQRRNKSQHYAFDLGTQDASEVLREMIRNCPDSIYKIAKQCGLGPNVLRDFVNSGTDAKASTTDPLWRYLHAEVLIPKNQGNR